MGKLLSLFDEICRIIGNEAEKLFGSPLFWVMVIVLIACLVLTYSGNTQNRLSGSVVNTFRQFGLFFLDAFNSVVQAFKSLFGFLDVVRLLFFGRLGNSTLYVLTNYAIVFLSIASFSTTLSGLRTLVGWLGILISFGVQVMELIAVMGLIVSCVHAKGRLKETVAYTYHTGGLPEPLEPTNEEKDADARDETSWQNFLTDSKAKIAYRTKRRKLPLWGKVRRKLMACALIVAYITSVSFSYCYMFGAIVMPTIAFDDYLESIELVNQVTEDYQSKLTGYRSDLVTALREFNVEITEYNGLSGSDLGTVNARLSYLDSRLDALGNQMTSLLTRMEEEETRRGSREGSSYQELQSRYTTTRENYESVREEIAELEEVAGSSDYILYQAIEELNRYYEDPLYLKEHMPDSVQDQFTIVIANGYMPHAEEISFHLESIRTAFANYTMLTNYYAEHDATGLDLTVSIEANGAESSVQGLLSNRAGVIDQYKKLNAAENASDSRGENRTDYEPNDNGKGDLMASAADQAAQLTDAEAETANDYLNGESARLLLATMAALEAVPVFSVTGEVRANRVLTEPSIASYLSKLNRQYRMVSDSVTLQERALRKLGHPFSPITWFSLFLAVILDGLIILLCFQRSRQYYENAIRNKRQLVSLLFVKPFTQQEGRENEDGRRVILAGTVLGSLIYLVYFRLFPDGGAEHKVLAFVLIVGAILFFALLQSLRGVLRRPSGSPAPPFSDERFQNNVYSLFSERLLQGQFLKRCTVQFPKTVLRAKMYAHNEQELDAWKRIEDYKYKAFVPKQAYYETLVTHESVGLEYYVLNSDIKNKQLLFQFALLQSHGLAYHVEIPENAIPAETLEGKEVGSPPKRDMKESVSAYVLPKELMRLFYECILLKTVMGNTWEYTMEDDLLDYERNDVDEDES